jgi:hypothetical protein
LRDTPPSKGAGKCTCKAREDCGIVPVATGSLCAFNHQMHRRYGCSTVKIIVVNNDNTNSNNNNNNDNVMNINNNNKNGNSNK